jgi:hypothetical protein
MPKIGETIPSNFGTWNADMDSRSLWAFTVTLCSMLLYFPFYIIYK